jgi:putative sigma-54 modulation protein
VILKVDTAIAPVQNKVCEVRLSVYGDDLLAHSRTESFRKSVREVLKELKKLVREQLARRQEPPDITTSSVRIE